MQYFDDLAIGTIKKARETYTFSADDIKSFAQDWDPMPFHLDESIAEASPIGALFASSIHIIAAAIKLSHSAMEEEVAVLAGLGWTDVNFPKPVLAGDTISVSSELIDKKASQSKPDRGVITTLNRIFNQHGEQVAEYKIKTMLMRNVQA